MYYYITRALYKCLTVTDIDNDKYTKVTFRYKLAVKYSIIQNSSKVIQGHPAKFGGNSLSMVFCTEISWLIDETHRKTGVSTQVYTVYKSITSTND